jgi:hypothetical protein
MITVDGGTSIDAGPDDRVWFAAVNFQDPRGGETVMMDREPNQTLHEALATALIYFKEDERLWAENYDPEAIREYLTARVPQNLAGM